MALLSDLINLNLSDTTEKIIAEYVWIGGSGMDLRSKARTLAGPVTDPSKLPKWNYDGLSTGQAPGEDSEVILYPQAIFKDPFRRGNNILVMCDAYTPAGEPIPTNQRYKAAQIFGHPDVAAKEPWYGIEQEYTLLQKDVKWPLGWPVGGFPGPQGPYYCGIGADKAFGRDIVDAHYKACLYAGIQISGINGEVMPGQWEFQVGPALGISAGDQLPIAFYILERITEIAGVVLSFDPKPMERISEIGGNVLSFDPRPIEGLANRLRRNSDQPTRGSMALAGFLGEKLSQTLSRASQQEVDVFFGPYETNKPSDHCVQQKEDVEKPQTSTDHQKAAAEAGGLQAEKEGASEEEKKEGSGEEEKLRRELHEA